MAATDSPRQEIDRLDREIVSLLARRMDAVRRIGRLKQTEGTAAVRDDARERDVSRAWADAARDQGLPAWFATRILDEILGHSRRIQEGATGIAEDAAADRTIVVAIQGGPRSFSDLALDQVLAGQGPGGPERLYLDSFTAAVDAVESGRAQHALLPIENTIAGSLNAVYRLLGERSVTIQAEEVLPIAHCLAGHPDAQLADVRRVLSHPVALQQCQRFLDQLAICTAESRSDTARAAEAVSSAERRDLAAICSEPCARALGLRILRRDIADSRRNATRFVLVGSTPAPSDHARPGRTSLMVSVDNRQGSLARCLEAFAHRSLNLSKLESRRRPGDSGEYLFYLDVDAWADTEAMQAALAEVRDYTNDFRLLGTYPREGDEAAALPVAPDAEAHRPEPAAATVSVTRRPTNDRAVVPIGGVSVGGGGFVLIAGPCAVESRQQVLAAAAMARDAGAVLLRGGAFKPRTSPHAFQGLGFAGLDLLASAGRAYDLPIVTEVLRTEDVERVAAVADCLQVGARNMQNFALLKKLGTLERPVLLKRGLSATIEDLLAAAEHILAGGNRRVILCERGIRTFETATRSTLDLSAVPALRERTNLPVIVDPSHAAGRRELVVPLALAAVAVGADGLMIELHPDPAAALCDGPQALTAADLVELRGGIAAQLAARGRADAAGAG